MKLEIQRFSMHIIPETPQDEAYLEEVMGAKNDLQNIPCIRVNASGLSCIAYIRVGRKEVWSDKQESVGTTSAASEALPKVMGNNACSLVCCYCGRTITADNCRNIIVDENRSFCSSDCQNRYREDSAAKVRRTILDRLPEDIVGKRREPSPEDHMHGWKDD